MYQYLEKIGPAAIKAACKSVPGEQLIAMGLLVVAPSVISYVITLSERIMENKYILQVTKEDGFVFAPSDVLCIRE